MFIFLSSEESNDFDVTLQGTNTSPQKWHFEDDLPLLLGGG